MNDYVKIGYSDKLIWFVCFYWLLIDSINGYFWNAKIAIAISQPIKMVLLAIVIYKLIANKQIALALIGLVFIFNLNFISSAFLNYPLTGTIQHLSKLLLTILLFVYFKYCITHWPYDIFEKRAIKVFKLGIIVLFSNVFLGLFGIGYHTYVTGEYGYKGFFASGNEMGGLVVVLIPVLLYWMYFSRTLSKYVFCTLLCILFAILLATKSVILIVAFFCIYIPFIFTPNKKTKRKIICGGILLITIAVYIFFNHLDRGATNFMVEFFYRYDKGGLLYLLLSSRNEFVMEQYKIFSSAPFYQQIFGMGCKVGNVDTVEMDFFDILFYYGYFGLMVTILITIKLFQVVNKARGRNRFINVIRMSDTLMIIMATIAGHILFSSTAGLYIALINAFLFTSEPYPLINRCLVRT